MKCKSIPNPLAPIHMSFVSIKKLLFITMLAAYINIAAAQADSQTYRLNAISLDSRIQDIKYQSNGEIQSLYVFKNQRSESFDYTGPSTIQFFRESSQLAADGSAVHIPVARCKLPSGGGEYLLIMSQQSKDPEKYRIFSLSDDWQGFSLGTYRFLNLAPFEIALKLDGEVHRIKERNFTDVSGDFIDNSQNKAMMVSLPEGEKPMRIFEGYMYYTEDQRMLYIISPKTGGRAGQVYFTGVAQQNQKIATE
jgi:hypothetical protein